jgi:mono/diheme cytochrome c family protein
MAMNAWANLCGIGVLTSASLMVACGPPPKKVTYKADVQPIFERYCVSCHRPGQPGYEASGLSLTNYDDVMKGTRYGPVVLPGEADTSALVMLIEGRADPSIKMPHGNAPAPTEADIRTVHDWVAAGAPLE